MDAAVHQRWCTGQAPNLGTRRQRPEGAMHLHAVRVTLGRHGHALVEPLLELHAAKAASVRYANALSAPGHRGIHRRAKAYHDQV